MKFIVTPQEVASMITGASQEDDDNLYGLIAEILVEGTPSQQHAAIIAMAVLRLAAQTERIADSY